jgi:hypothetical protein
MDFTKSLGRHIDIPQLFTHRVAATAAGSAADYEFVLGTIPNLSLLPGVNKGALPSNDIMIRDVILTPEANLTGSASHSFYWALRQWRGGSVLQQVNTTCPNAITAGSGVVVTPASMTNITVGQLLTVSGGTGSSEVVQVTAVVAGVSFTATFANNHSGAYTIKSSNLASIDYNSSSITETAYTPHQLPDLTNNIALISTPLLPGDVLTFQRVSSDSTGLASPAVGVIVEYGSVMNNQFWG